MSWLTDMVIPPWARWAAIAALLAASGGFGYLRGLDHGTQKLTDYVAKQATQTSKIAQAQAKVVVQTQVVYKDRIQTVYLQGAKIEERAAEILTPAVDQHLPLPAGFVRLLDAAWTGDAVGPATSADGEPASVPASIVAENEIDNATSCRVWRTQALGWREFYAKQQIAINGKAGDWYHSEQ